MIRKFSVRNFMIPVLAGAALGLVGCGGGDDDDSPSPTPEPMDDNFRITALAIGDSSTGVDLDGDGSVDNNIEDALVKVQASLIDAIGAALEAQGIPMEGETCEDTDPQTPCGQTILATAEQVLAEALSVENLSESISRPIEDGEINYLLNFQEAGAGVDLSWCTGRFNNTAWACENQLGTQSGSLDGSGNGTFGPGDLTLRFYFESTNQQGETNTVEIPITLYNAMTVIAGYNEQKINDMTMGGAISTEDLLSLIENALTTINDEIPGTENDLDVDTIMTNLEAAIVAAEIADIDINGDGTNEGFSVGLEGSADMVTVTE